MTTVNNYLAGGVNSPISFPTHYPSDIISGTGAYVINKDGEKYIDLWMGYGALLHGHQHETEKHSIKEQLDNGWFFSYPTVLEKKLAKKLHELIPSADLVRFSTSGSDAVAYAIRISRQYTNRQAVLAIDGGYHGVHENMISTAGTLSAQTPDLTRFNAIDETIEKIRSKKYACIILEPILANNGCVPPQEGFLQAVRQACTESGTVLIFDEVVVGFRTSLHGAQSLFGVTPDLTTFSKAIAGGLPLSAVCGKREVMQQLTPQGEVFFAGTFNGSPISLANALGILKTLEDEYPYEEMSKFRQRLSDQLLGSARRHGIELAIQGIASMMSLAFDCTAYTHGVSIANANADKYTKFADYMANRKNILLPPLFTETFFLAPVHIELESTLVKAFDEGFRWLSQQK